MPESHAAKEASEETLVPVDILPTLTSTKLNMGEASNRYLILYSVGIFVCYFYYGILQEKM